MLSVAELSAALSDDPELPQPAASRATTSEQKTPMQLFLCSRGVCLRGWLLLQNPFRVGLWREQTCACFDVRFWVVWFMILFLLLFSDF